MRAKSKTPARNLKLARELSNFDTAKDAADYFGWKYVTYKAHESGLRGIRKPVARKYTVAFGVDWPAIMDDSLELKCIRLARSSRTG